MKYTTFFFINELGLYLRATQANNELKIKMYRQGNKILTSKPPDSRRFMLYLLVHNYLFFMKN